MRRFPLILLAGLLAGLLAAPLAAQGTPPAFDKTALMKETQFTSSEPGVIRILWWIPIDFWAGVLANNPTVTPEAAEDVLSRLRPFLVVAVADGQTTGAGFVRYLSRDSIRASLRLSDATGTTYVPLAEDSLPEDTRELIGVFQPVFARMLGPLGEHLVLVFFNGTGANAQPLVDARRPGAINIQYRGTTSHIRLPLGSLLPPKRCPVDGELLSGAWNYCPIHGKALEPVGQ